MILDTGCRIRSYKLSGHSELKNNQSDIVGNNPSPTFFITTLGCKVNQYESDAIALYLKNAGWSAAQPSEKADWCIINTCTVTQKAAMQSRQAARQAIRNNPGARVIMTGCYAQIEPDEIKKIEGIYAVIGHTDKHKIPEMIIAADQQDQQHPVCVVRDILHESDFHQIPVTAFGARTRPFLKIQDGCDTFCSYCIVPYARGPSRSMAVEAALNHINKLQQAGFHEVVLTGVHLGAYGLDLVPQTDLYTLLRRIRKASLIDRVRLSSIEPHELTSDIIQLVVDSECFCLHFHIPLQSGDDRILQKMHRPYSSSFFRDLIFQIRTSIPDAAIGADILIGFPGETEAAFENTFDLVKELPITYLHVFPFSARAGTPASRYPHQVPTAIIKTRCEKMRRLGNVKKQDFYHQFIGQDVDVLIEGQPDVATGLSKGLTSNYIPVFTNSKNDLANSIVPVRIDKLFNDNSLFGTIVTS